MQGIGLCQVTSLLTRIKVWHYTLSLERRSATHSGCDGEDISHRLIAVLSHRLYRYHRGVGGSFEFSLFSSLSLGFKYPVSIMRVVLWL